MATRLETGSSGVVWVDSGAVSVMPQTIATSLMCMRERDATGFVSLKPDPTAQVAGQMQVVVTIPGTGDLQFFVQLQRSYTWAPDASKDWSLGLGFQKSFDVTPGPKK